MKQQAIVMVYGANAFESRVDCVYLPDGHKWNNTHLTSKWGANQVCEECGIKIRWSNIDRKWEMNRPRKYNVIPSSCEEVKMEEALE